MAEKFTQRHTTKQCDEVQRMERCTRNPNAKWNKQKIIIQQPHAPPNNKVFV